MGYGSRALELLQQYYEGKVLSLTEGDTAVPQEAQTVTSEVSAGIQNTTMYPCALLEIM